MTTKVLMYEGRAISDTQEREAIRLRLILIRKMVTADNQAEFARRIGIALNRWTKLEQGSPLTLRQLFQIASRVSGVTVAYIAKGDTSRLSPFAARKLAALEAEMFPRKKDAAYG